MFPSIPSITLPLLVKLSCKQSRDRWFALQATNSSISLCFSTISDASSPFDHILTSIKATKTTWFSGSLCHDPLLIRNVPVTSVVYPAPEFEFHLIAPNIELNH